MWLDKVLPFRLRGEVIVFYLRPHWLVLAKKIAFFVVLFALPAAVAYVLARFRTDDWEIIWSGGLLEVLVQLGLSLYYIGVWSFFWSAWVDYYLDVVLITNERIVSLRQNGLFNRSISELRLVRVQDVSAQVKGFLATVLHFGDVTVQTAGEQINFSFKSIPQPYQVAERILRLADDWRSSHPSDKSP